jgi:glycosyltransferase involved in cell wall biosynthesis
MMNAFKEEFAGDRDVALIMKMGSDRYCIPKIFYALDLPRNIHWMRSFVPDTSDLYRGMNAYIATDNGEGWGAPTTEAMLCGIPTIAPRHSGHLDYMNDNNSYLIDVGDWEYIGFDKEHPERMPNLYMDLLGPQLEWKVPLFDDIKLKMRQCYEKYKDMTREEVIADQMVQNALKVSEITSEEYVGKQLKTALDWYENEYR